MNENAHFAAWLDEIVELGESLPYNRDRYEYDWALFQVWRARAETLLIELLGPNSVYYQRFVAATMTSAGSVSTFYRDSSLGILKGVRADFIAGRLASLRSLVTAEVFADFLDMADHLLANGYKDPSASLIGAVLERGLRDLARKNALSIRKRDDLSALNSKLAQAGVYSRLAQQNIQVWATIRNYADHGQFDQYDKQGVSAMLAGVRSFLE